MDGPEDLLLSCSVENAYKRKREETKRNEESLKHLRSKFKKFKIVCLICQTIPDRKEGKKERSTPLRMNAPITDDIAKEREGRKKR